MAQVSIAGSTGSVGTQALEVIATSLGQFEVASLCGNSDFELLARQANEYRPPLVGIFDKNLASRLEDLLDYSPEVVVGPEALQATAQTGEVVLNAVVGFAGLPVTLTALREGKRLALANKESLVAAGGLVSRVRDLHGGEIVPVDSEHSAIHQALRSSASVPREVSRLILTASGGPFRGKDSHYLAGVSLSDALEHPTWSMGPKITIDSSTLMNKGLEVIEAHELFGIDYESIEVVVHPQSLVHSMVEFTDGSAIAQISGPDMRLPIGYALGYPSRLEHRFGHLNWNERRVMEFEAPDLENFPALTLAYSAGRRGGGAPAWLNAANETAVAAFLAGGIKWREIYEVVARSLDFYHDRDLESIEAVLEVDAAARDSAKLIIEKL